MCLGLRCTCQAARGARKLGRCPASFGCQSLLSGPVVTSSISVVPPPPV